MSEQRKNGGPAFPLIAQWPTLHVGNPGGGVGMSLRDYFAAAALQGYRAAYHQWYQRVGATGELAGPDEMARWAYADADAMLKARETD